MKHECPCCGETEFVVTAHVCQDWLVDADGNYIETISECSQTLYAPNDEDLWSCARCGCIAVGSSLTKLRWKTFKSYDAKINKGRFSNVFRLADKIPGDADAFVPITVHAQLSKDEWEETRDWAEPPLAILAVKESFIADYVKRAGYPSLDAFFKEYTYGFIEGLQKRAEHESALAFAYRPGLTQKYQFPAGNMPKGAGQALQEFMAMESAYARILAMLPDHPSIESEFWTNGEDIIAPNIDAANVIADFLESVGVDCPITGSFDIEEDTRNGEVDQLTGYAYISG